MVLRLLDHGRLLYGGTPPRFIKLTDEGRAQALGVLRTEGDSSKSGAIEPRLRRRLVNAGMLPPVQPGPGPLLPTFGFVIPHFNDPEGAAHSVTMLMSACSEAAGPELGDPTSRTVVVVDDGSAAPALREVRRLLDPLSRTVMVMEQPTNVGPGAARNAGAAALDTEVIVFVDCGVTTTADTLDQLISWFNEVSVAAAAPRIRPSVQGGAIGRYERVFSPLDVGRDDLTQPALVGRGRPISYVPSTVLAVRSEAFRNVGGFDDSLRYGEDVDLIWRLDGSEGRVVLDPGITAEHPARSTIAEFAVQRFRYGTSAGPLGHRHGTAVAPAVLRPGLALAAAVSLVAPLGVTSASILVALAQDAQLRSRSFDRATNGLPGVAALGAVESVRFNVASAVSFVSAMCRPWWPITALLIAQPWSSRLRRRAAGAVLARLFHRARAVGVTDTPLVVVDDLAYGSGVWLGVAEEGRFSALLPRLLRGR